MGGTIPSLQSGAKSSRGTILDVTMVNYTFKGFSDVLQDVWIKPFGGTCSEFNLESLFGIQLFGGLKTDSTPHFFRPGAARGSK